MVPLCPVRSAMMHPMARVHCFVDDALGEHDAVALGRLLRAREVSARELADAALARAERLAYEVEEARPFPCITR